ncbi:DUF3817 domain-containing protein [Garicola koreensis]|uniref:Integral membrane protein n=1 Tax=Garicola koreensis TaxID=1262554 RepID=A0A7W5TSD0_9MICC|nr:integral membrane protein [Garicola koreensis]
MTDPESRSHSDDELNLGTPPPRPKQRRFSGTVDQISGSLNFYRVFAFITGVMLLILVAKMIMDYGFGYELYAGGATLAGEANSLGFHPQGSIVDGEAISFWVAVIHGWIYVVYVVAGFRLWYLMSWPIGRLLVIVAGGVVPFLSFIVERRIAAEVRREVQQNPQAARRY